MFMILGLSDKIDRRAIQFHDWRALFPFEIAQLAAHNRMQSTKDKSTALCTSQFAADTLPAPHKRLNIGFKKNNTSNSSVLIILLVHTVHGQQGPRSNRRHVTSLSESLSG